MACAVGYCDTSPKVVATHQLLATHRGGLTSGGLSVMGMQGFIREGRRATRDHEHERGRERDLLGGRNDGWSSLKEPNCGLPANNPPPSHRLPFLHHSSRHRRCTKWLTITSCMSPSLSKVEAWLGWVRSSLWEEWLGPVGPGWVSHRSSGRRQGVVDEGSWAMRVHSMGVTD